MKHILLTEMLKCANSGERDTVQTMSHGIQLYRGTLNVVEFFYVCLPGNEMLWVMCWTLIRSIFLTYELHSSVIFNIFFLNSNFVIMIKSYWTATYSSSYRTAITPHQQWTMWARAAAAAAAAMRVVPSQAIRVK